MRNVNFSHIYDDSCVITHGWLHCLTETYRKPKISYAVQKVIYVIQQSYKIQIPKKSGP